MTDTEQEQSPTPGVEAPKVARRERVKTDADEDFGQVRGPVTDDDGEVYLHPHDLRWLEVSRLRAERARDAILLIDAKEYRLKRQLEDQLRALGVQKNEHRTVFGSLFADYEQLRDTISERYSIDLRSAGYDDDTGRIELVGDGAEAED